MEPLSQRFSTDNSQPILGTSFQWLAAFSCHCQGKNLDFLILRTKEYKNCFVQQGVGMWKHEAIKTEWLKKKKRPFSGLNCFIFLSNKSEKLIIPLDLCLSVLLWDDGLSQILVEKHLSKSHGHTDHIQFQYSDVHFSFHSEVSPALF